MLSRRFALVTILCAVLAAGCDESLESVAGPTPNLTPTFASIQRDIFQASDSSGRPSCTSCHNPNGGAFRAVGLDLTTEGYASLVGVASRQRPNVLRVAPGDPANSYLIQKIEAQAADIVGVRMPQRGPFLTDGQIAIIERWIELGAKND
jgi:cytochrome c peroxidase